MRESDLFDYLKANYFSDLQKSEIQFSKWDCYSSKYNSRIELKCRNKHYDFLMIERSKYYYLIKMYIEKDETPLYINSTPKGVYSFDLRKITPTWITDSRMPQTTEFEKISKVEKTYSLLNISEAKKIQ
jgi:hypothetical protein